MLAAVAQDGSALRCARDTDLTPTRARINQSSDVSRSCSWQTKRLSFYNRYAAAELWKSDREIIMKSTETDGYGALAYTTLELRSDPVVVGSAVAQNGESLHFARKDGLRNDQGIVLMAVAQVRKWQ